MRKFTQLFICSIFLACSFLFSLGAEAQFGDFPKPKYNVGPTRLKELIVENAYVYRVMLYEPKVKIKPVVSRSDSSYQTPEDAVIAHFSAMFAQDYEWFLDTWTEESKHMMAERNKLAGRGPDYWISAWKKVLLGKTVTLTTRIETGNFVLIEYTLSTAQDPGASFRDTVAVTKRGTRWLLTQELAADPVLSSWDSPTGRIQRLER